MNECLMTDGNHAEALPGHDLCRPCELHMAEEVGCEGDYHGIGCEHPTCTACGEFLEFADDDCTNCGRKEAG